MKPLATYQKLRGGYYTPEPIARFLAEWTVASSGASVLEPGCGDGVLVEAAARVLRERGANPSTVGKLIEGIEIDPGEAEKARLRLKRLGVLGENTVVVGDFFRHCWAMLNEKRCFDAVIGNPPFIRYQNFPEDLREIAFGIMRSAGLRPNRLTNTWVPFLVASSLLLKREGRLGIVIPAELLQVNYAAELRYFLSDYYSKLTIVTFKRLVFPEIQQEVVLLLGERNGSGRTGIRTIELDDIEDLETYKHVEFAERDLQPMDHSTEKWTQYFLTTDEILLLRRLRNLPAITPAAKVMSVDVGVVTGLNDFFVLTKAQSEEHGVGNFTIPLVSRSAHLIGLFFRKGDWRSNVEDDLPTFLLVPPSVPFEQLPRALQKYVAAGEAKGFHKGYKCRIREPWYVVPSLWTPDAFLLRQIHHYPKIVVNNAGATCTDTIHRIKFLNGAKAETIAAAFLNALTFAFSEVMGRSYGGGVLELEPREAEKLPLPLVNAERLDSGKLDGILRRDGIHAVLELTDKSLLRDGLGLKAEEVQRLRRIWEKLRDRRISRKHTRSNFLQSDLFGPPSSGLQKTVQFVKR